MKKLTIILKSIHYTYILYLKSNLPSDEEKWANAPKGLKGL